jgi:hypothetical protein
MYLNVENCRFLYNCNCSCIPLNQIPITTLSFVTQSFNNCTNNLKLWVRTPKTKTCDEGNSYSSFFFLNHKNHQKIDLIQEKVRYRDREKL